LETVEDFLDSTYSEYDVFSFRGGRLVRGRLRAMTDDCMAGLKRRLQGMGWLHAFENIDGAGYLTCTVMDSPARPRKLLHLGLFLLTIMTTMIAGGEIGFGQFYVALQSAGFCVYQAGVAWVYGPHAASPAYTPLFWLGQAGLSLQSIMALMAEGLPFSFAILTILGCHEMGHYVAARRYGMNATLPFFIPVPMGIGTLGAVIRIKSPMVHRRAVLDVGVAGPLAGAVLSVVFLVVGLSLSRVARFDPDRMIPLGESLFSGSLTRLVCGAIPRGAGLVRHPFALAGWLGLLVTAINLMPIGQLDGGHIAYAFFGRFQRRLALMGFGLLITLGIVGMLAHFHLVGAVGKGYIPWLLCALFMRSFMKPSHPPALDERVKLDPGRKAVALLCFALLILLFVPCPIAF